MGKGRREKGEETKEKEKGEERREKEEREKKRTQGISHPAMGHWRAYSLPVLSLSTWE